MTSIGIGIGLTSIPVINGGGAVDPIAEARAAYDTYYYKPSPETLTSDGSTPVAVDGAIQTYAEAGAGPTLAQTVAVAKPIYREGGYVDFQGNDSIEGAISPAITPAKFALFAQFYGPGPQANSSGFLAMGTTFGAGIQLGAINGGANLYLGYKGTNVDTGVALPAGQATLLLTSEAGSQKLYLNGGAPIYSGTDASVPTLSVMRLGVNRAGSIYWDGYVGTVFFLRDIPPASEINAIGAALEAQSATSWGGWTDVS